jgi:hypothetical protein
VGDRDAVLGDPFHSAGGGGHVAERGGLVHRVAVGLDVHPCGAQPERGVALGVRTHRGLGGAVRRLVIGGLAVVGGRGPDRGVSQVLQPGAQDPVYAAAPSAPKLTAAAARAAPSLRQEVC